MTTAHRPTFDPAKGKEAQRGVAYHQRLLPAHKELKFRQPGQGGDADHEVRDLRAELLKAEAAHFAKTKGTSGALPDAPDRPKRLLEDGHAEEEEDMATKRRRVLEETRDLDADSDGEANGSSSDERLVHSLARIESRIKARGVHGWVLIQLDSDDDEEDEEAELMRELAKIKRERAEAKEREDRERAAQDEAEKEVDIARGNPLLNPSGAVVKRRWDEDVVFKNQARGTEDKRKKEFVNDLLRSDFHKRFMVGHTNSGAVSPSSQVLVADRRYPE
ncbi:MAG: hypothetical protein M1824_003194 [Vezdaea acicularis]|nr:MAG: hypothetical protein M1824_003194 [Vezdaea acicularis]